MAEWTASSLSHVEYCEECDGSRLGKNDRRELLRKLSGARQRVVSAYKKQQKVVRSRYRAVKKSAFREEASWKYCSHKRPSTHHHSGWQTS